MKITNSEKMRIMEAATKAMANKPPVVFNLDMVLVVGLIGQLQLAFRHPQNTGATRQILQKFVLDLINRLDPGKGDLWTFLMMAFDERFDE